MGSDAAAGGISERGQKALLPALSYGMAFMQAQARPWSKEDPEGNIICSVAENKLSVDLIHAKMMELQQGAPASTLCYPKGFRGFPEARQAMAHMLKRTFMKGVDVDPENLAILSGAGAVLDLTFWCLTERGEGVLLPLPIYPAFLNDMDVRAGAYPVLFDLLEEQDVADQLSTAAAGAAAAGHPVRVVLLAHPNNPMGVVYKRDTIKDILIWCLKNNVHLISDEIYGNSVWGDSGPEFVSAEVVARQELAERTLTPTQVERLPNLLHIIGGLSKDFCASGLRVGFLHTRNTTLMGAIQNLSYFHTCSTPTLWTLSQLLSDDEFLDSFVKENNRRMRESYKGLEEALVAADIPHIKASAAMFCWIDLRAGLLQPSWEGEQELWRAMCEAGVLFTPGEACKAREPGFFRICWAWVPPEALPEAVRRVKALLDKRNALKDSSGTGA